MQILEIMAKVGDTGTYNLFDDGQEIVNYRGNVPDWISPEHYEDYLLFQIDVETGQILNWDVVSDLLAFWIERHK